MAQERKRRRSRKKVGFLIKLAIVVAVACTGGVLSLGFMNYTVDDDMTTAVNIDTIYNNITVNGVDVGGLTREQALEKLNAVYQPELNRKKITFRYGDNVKELGFAEFGARYDCSAGVEEAYQYAREGSIKERYAKILGLDEAPYHVTCEPVYLVDESKAAEKVRSAEDAVYVAPVNASLTRSNGKFSTTPSSNGQRLNVEETAKQVEALLVENKEGIVDAVIETVEPQYLASDFDKAQSLIGTFSTTFTGGDSARNTNIKTAASKLNDQVVYPGEVFSTNAAFGASTYENGYRSAPVIIGGKLQDDFGGGVCQVSSALYNALLFAELQIVERQNHSLKVGYLDYGYDATLAGDYIDLKFKNDTQYPVFIETYINSANKLTVNLYGHEIHGPGRTLEFKNALLETIQPGAEEVKEDPNLPLGKRVEETPSRIGYKYDLYKIVYENGKEVERVKVNSSYYKPTRGLVHVGTGPEEEVLPEGEDAQASNTQPEPSGTQPQNVLPENQPAASAPLPQLEQPDQSLPQLDDPVMP